MTARYSQQQLQDLTQAVLQDGFCILRQHFSPETLSRWHQAFTPLLTNHITREGDLQNRGTARYYVTLPFQAPFADPSIYEDDDILAIAV